MRHYSIYFIYSVLFHLIFYFKYTLLKILKISHTDYLDIAYKFDRVRPRISHWNRRLRQQELQYNRFPAHFHRTHFAMFEFPEIEAFFGSSLKSHKHRLKVNLSNGSPSKTVL